VLNSLPREHYEKLADDPDERVRELATFFLVPCWRADNTLVRLQEQLARSQRQAAENQSLIADMRSSKFWKIREIAVRWKNAIPLLRRRTA
jgi:hypothetical protein